MPFSICEPIGAGIFVSLFNKYILNGGWRRCQGQRPDQSDDSASSISSVAPETGAINADFEGYHHSHASMVNSGSN